MRIQLIVISVVVLLLASSIHSQDEGFDFESSGDSGSDFSFDSGEQTFLTADNAFQFQETTGFFVETDGFDGLVVDMVGDQAILTTPNGEITLPAGSEVQGTISQTSDGTAIKVGDLDTVLHEGSVIVVADNGIPSFELQEGSVASFPFGTLDVEATTMVCTQSCDFASANNVVFYSTDTVLFDYEAGPFSYTAEGQDPTTVAFDDSGVSSQGPGNLPEDAFFYDEADGKLYAYNAEANAWVPVDSGCGTPTGAAVADITGMAGDVDASCGWFAGKWQEYKAGLEAYKQDIKNALSSKNPPPGTTTYYPEGRPKPFLTITPPPAGSPQTAEPPLADGKNPTTPDEEDDNDENFRDTQVYGYGPASTTEQKAANPTQTKVKYIPSYIDKSAKAAGID
ncbi:MAG: hypothetical protein V1837_01225 [Candidatus Woesearchaeota archaeon]